MATPSKTENRRGSKIRTTSSQQTNRAKRKCNKNGQGSDVWKRHEQSNGEKRSIEGKSRYWEKDGGVFREPKKKRDKRSREEDIRQKHDVNKSP